MADFARELLRAYPDIQEEDVEVMCEEALIALFLLSCFQRGTSPRPGNELHSAPD